MLTQFFFLVSLECINFKLHFCVLMCSCVCVAGPLMDDYLQYVGGPVGVAALTGAAAATALYMACSPTPMCPPVDIDDQSVEIPVSAPPSFSHTLLCSDLF